MLQVKDLHVSYGDVEVIADFSLEVHAGEFFTLLGPSGCGKTTILHRIAGLAPVSQGRIILDGKDITDLPPEKRDVGMVFQNYALFPNMSVFENIAFSLRARREKSRAIAPAVDRMLELTGLLEFRHRWPEELSGGQQQRCAIARALVMGSKYLLFDEPLSNLDAKVRATMRDEIKRLQQELGFTAVFVTHDQEEALSLSDRLLVLNQGRIEQVGTAKELYTKPATPFVCQFIGAVNELQVDFVAAHFPELGATAAADTRYFVRPEAIKVAAGDGVGRLAATVRAIDYLGAYSRVSLEVGTCVLQMQCVSEDMLELSPGTQCELQIVPGKIMAIKR